MLAWPCPGTERAEPDHGLILACKPWGVGRVTASPVPTESAHQDTLGVYLSLQGLELRAHVSTSHVLV